MTVLDKIRQEPVPTATVQTSRVVQQIIGLLEQSRRHTNFSTFEHFSRSVRIWDAALRLAEMGEWLALCQGMERGLGPLAQALARLMEHAQYSYEDVPGLVYMALNLGDIRKGQYFTPFAVAKMLAEMTLRDLKPPGPGEPPIRIYEPACGSGVMFLAAMAVLEERYPGMLERGEVEFHGSDLDPTCVSMCRLNLRLHRLVRALRQEEPVAEALRAPEPSLAIKDASDLPLPDPVASHPQSTRHAQYTFF